MIRQDFIKRSTNRQLGDQEQLQLNLAKLEEHQILGGLEVQSASHMIMKKVWKNGRKRYFHAILNV